MEERQQTILTRNLRFLSEKIKAGKVVERTKELYPDIFNRGDLKEIKGKSGEPRIAYIISRFKVDCDGYAKLFDVLKDTGHGDIVLNVLRPGLNLPRRSSASSSQASGTSQAGSDVDGLHAKLDALLKHQDERDERLASRINKDVQANIEKAIGTMRDDISELKRKIDKLDVLENSIKKLEEGLKSESKAKAGLEKIVKEISTQMNELKMKINEMEKREVTLDSSVVDKITERLQKLEKDFVMSEIDGLRKEVHQVRIWVEKQCGSMKTRLDTLETENAGQQIVQSDVKKLALKLKTQWEVIARDVGIEGEKIKHSRGTQVLEGEAAAEAFISQWIAMSSEKDMATSTPPTWDALYEITKRHDKNVAEEIRKMKKHTEK